MEEIVIYAVNREEPLRIRVRQVISGMSVGVGHAVAFIDEEGNEGRILVNPDNIQAVFITSVNE